MKLFICVLHLLICTCFAKAQKITGYIKDTKLHPLAGATVFLHLAKDSAIIKINASNINGNYSFSSISPGKYFIEITTIGYKTTHSAIFSSGNSDIIIPTLFIEKSTTNLNEVVVNSKRPLIEVNADKTIFNVESSINAVGSDAMELLRKSPGVVIDRDDNLIMNGKNGVTVYIDGRVTPLSGQSLSNYLRSLPSASIDAIEIITNPSAKYDAAGNAGIINIKLKKNNAVGTNGNVNAGYSMGIYSKYLAGFSFNNRNSRFNIFGNYNYNQATNDSKLQIRRTLSDTAFDQYSITTSKIKSHNYKAGIDYFINKNNTVGVIVNGNIDNSDISLYSTTSIIYTATGTIERWLVADNKNQFNNRNNNLNFNFRHTGKNGSELNMDADAGHYRLRSDQMQPNYYYDASFTNITGEHIYQMLAPSDIDIYSYKADYEQDFEKGKLGFGGKISYVNSENDFDQYNVYIPAKEIDSAKSNRFNYRENINAGYLNYNRRFKKVVVQAGLRVENSNISLRSVGYKMTGNSWQPYDSFSKRHYTDFFPSAAITFTKDANNQLGLTYSRRIDRPAYQDLNPFEIKIDEYSYYKGNTELRPQYSNSIAITHSYKGVLNSKLSYSLVNDVFTRLADTVEVVKSYLMKKNVATQKILSLNISYNLQQKWYTLFVNVNAFSSQYQADFGMGKTIDLSVNAFTANLQQSASLGKGWSIEMNGFYNSPAIWSGTFRSDEMFGLEGGFQKKVLKEKGNIRVSVSDLLNNTRWHGVSNFSGQVMDVHFKWESQLFKVNFSYRFGNAQLKAARQRKTAADEEGKRVGTGGGGLQN